jgi:hypothetical protein
MKNINKILLLAKAHFKCVDGFQLTTRIFKIRNIVEGCLKHLNKVPYIYQGSPHLQKQGDLTSPSENMREK